MKNLIFLILSVSFLFAKCDKVVASLYQDFESTKIGDIPFGWMMSSTGQKSLGIWEVVEGKSVYMKYPRGSFGEQFNILYTKDLYFKNGVVQTKIRAYKGRENRGGGVVWRLKDRKDYYFVLIDFLKKTLFVSFVKNGKIKNIVEKDIKLKKGWNILKVKFCDENIDIFLNNKNVVNIKDKSIIHSGGAGIITKADAKTFFDEIKIEVLK